MNWGSLGIRLLFTLHLISIWNICARFSTAKHSTTELRGASPNAFLCRHRGYIISTDKIFKYVVAINLMFEYYPDFGEIIFDYDFKKVYDAMKNCICFDEQDLENILQEKAPPEVRHERLRQTPG